MAEFLLRPEQTEDALPPGIAIPTTPLPKPAPEKAPVFAPVAKPAPESVAPPINAIPPAAPVKSEAPAVFGNEPMIKTPSAAQQSWGTVISIGIIVVMVVIGAFYAWGERIAQERAQYAPLEAQ